MNYTHIAGHLGADPETRFTSSGKKVTSLRVACKSGRDGTIWWRVTIWGDQFDKMLPYFKKGGPIVVVGEMSVPEIFTDKEGNPQISLQLVAFSISFSPFGRSSKGSSDSQTYGGNAGSGGGSDGYDEESKSFSDQGSEKNSEEEFSDEEIPF